MSVQRALRIVGSASTFNNRSSRLQRIHAREFQTAGYRTVSYVYEHQFLNHRIILRSTRILSCGYFVDAVSEKPKYQRLSHFIFDAVHAEIPYLEFVSSSSKCQTLRIR